MVFIVNKDRMPRGSRRGGKAYLAAMPGWAPRLADSICAGTLADSCEPRISCVHGVCVMSAKRRITVVAAVIVEEGRILAAQRSPKMSLPGMWEFPGGKIEPGESPTGALERELAEELGCRVEVGDHVETTEHEYDFGVVTLMSFYCKVVDGAPHAKEHAELRWVAAGQLGELEWAPADLPAVDRVIQFMAA